MAKISCNIIQDLLPLYCDDVCSPDSRKMVEDHLRECENCLGLLRQLQCVYKVNAPEMSEDAQKERVLEKISRGWKQSLLKTALRALLTGIVCTAVALSAVYGVHDFLFVQNRDLVPPEQVSVTVYRSPEIAEQQISVKMQPSDGYYGGTMDTYVDEKGKLYISILRKRVKETLPDGENEVMVYGFDQAKKQYTAVYYGSPDDCKLIWEPGDVIPDAVVNGFEK